MTTDRVANKHSLVPAIQLVDSSLGGRLYGDLDVVVSTATCTPQAGQGERSFGEWSATDSKLYALIDDDDRGPRSGIDSDYKSICLANGRHRMMVTESAVLGACEGKTAWGNSGTKRIGMLLAWKWNLADISEIRVHRIKKMLKMWDVGLTISCSDPESYLEYSGFGEAAPPFRATDNLAKAASVDGSAALGFAHTIARLASSRLDRNMERTSSNDGEIVEDLFRLS